MQQASGGADRAPHQFAAAIGAMPAEHRLGTIPAECAFVGADARFRAVRWQVAVTAFAVGSQFEHRRPPQPAQPILREKVADGERLSL